MNNSINDPFMNPNNRFGFTVAPFKIGVTSVKPRPDVPEWRINRSRARSMGKRTYLHTKPCKACSSLNRRVHNNECFDCWSLGK